MFTDDTFYPKSVKEMNPEFNNSIKRVSEIVNNWCESHCSNLTRSPRKEIVSCTNAHDFLGPLYIPSFLSRNFLPFDLKTYRTKRTYSW